MNNPHNLPPQDRAITPTLDANKGINYRMSKARRARKQERHKKNISNRKAG